MIVARVSWNFENRSSRRMCSLIKGDLRNFAKFTVKHRKTPVPKSQPATSACNSIKKETLAQLFFCEFCEMPINIVFTECLRVTASLKSFVALEVLESKEIVGLKEILFFWQIQPSRDFLRMSCSENMQQNYRRTPMPKCDFSNVGKQLYWNGTSAWVFYCKFAAYFQNSFV